MNADRTRKEKPLTGFDMQSNQQSSNFSERQRDNYSVHRADLERDAAEIRDFWIGQFPQWKVSKYKYFFLDNPDGRAECWLVRESAENRLVGTLAILRRNFYIDGTPHPAAIMADLVVHNEHRRKGLSVMLYSSVGDYLNNSDLIAVFGTPNTNSRRGALRAGYQIAGIERRYVCLLRSEPFLLRKIRIPILARLLALPIDLWLRRNLGGKPDRQYHTAITDQLDNRVDEVFASASNVFRIVGRRQTDWVNWRVSECPYRDLRIFSVFESESGPMIGYVAFQTDGKIAGIFDYLAKDIASLTIVFDQFVRHQAQQQIESIEVLPRDNPAIESCLKACAFTARSDGRSFILLFPNDSPHASLLLDAKNWFFTTADNDA